MNNLLRAGALALALLSCAPVQAQTYDPTKDDFAANFQAQDSQCSHWTTITPSDTVDLARYPKAIYVGGAGDITMIGAKAPNAAVGVQWKAVPASAFLPVRPRRILATGTTATLIVGCF